MTPSSPGDRLRERCESEGSVAFAAWMDEALYGAGGYYTRAARKTGADPDDSDFATSPTLNPFFAEAIAREVTAVWRRAGTPSEFRVVEFGGGEGHLARDALAWLDAHRPDLAAAITWTHVETSPHHQEAQESDDERIDSAAAMPRALVGAVVANEFVDALPFHWLERRKSSWAEVRVVAKGPSFAETLGLAAPAALAAAPNGAFADGQRVVAMARARHWIRDVGLALARGAVLVADYGARGQALWNRDRDAGTVRAFRAHQIVDDVLADPGQQDITASVDFEQLAVWAGSAGLNEASFESQEAFLLRHGVLDALNAQQRDTVEGASQYLRLRQLVLPTGLGGAFQIQRFEKGLAPEDDA